MTETIKELKERIHRLQVIILQQEELVKRQEARIHTLTLLLHVPKDAEPMESHVTVVESERTEQDVFSDEVKRLQHIRDEGI
jgi:hypothetical protein